MNLIIALVMAFLTGTNPHTADVIHPVNNHYGVMAIGDSITEGFASPTGSGYRYELEALRKPLWLGSRVDQYGLKHEGRSGWTTKQIADNVITWMQLGKKPNLILLDVGTNDAKTDNGKQMIASLNRLLANIRSVNPKVVILLAQITISTGWNATQQQAEKDYNAALPGIAGVTLVDMRDIPLVDGIHPTGAGCKMMADRWSAKMPRGLPV